MTTTTASKNSNMLRFEDGAVQFRQRIVVSLLTNRPLLIRNIRSNNLTPGLQLPEVSFLRLIDQMTDGSRIEINHTGTQLRFVPGVLLGGEIEHACPVGRPKQQKDTQQQEQAQDEQEETVSYRSIGWFLEGILPLAPFGKEHLSIRFTGITDGAPQDPSPDYLKATVMPLFQHFGVAQNADDDLLAAQPPHIKVTQRGAAPTGGGQVLFYCPVIRQELSSIDLIEPGLVKRVRGQAISCKLVSSSQAARVAFAAKGLLQRLLPDVWIHTDVHTVKQHACGPTASLSLVLTAESTTGCILAAETCLGKRELPEDLGQRGAALLLEQIKHGGCVDTHVASLVLLWMCLTPTDVSRVRLGTLTAYTIESLRLFKTAFGVEFKIKADVETKTVLLSCLGTGYRNMARAST